MKENILKISEVAPNYVYQGPRFKDLGPNSGEEFRKNILEPWLKKVKNDEEITIDFGGTKMFSPSFLEEAFGGAVRDGLGEQIANLKFVHIPVSWEKDVTDYIKEAMRVERKK
ncbi:MAG: STAS-like domain-containing protein [Spirochaetia bacterium]|jgi:hypothetical protein|nr:STAS-like domain-containing protein [Spirochaetia bacterium]